MAKMFILLTGQKKVGKTEICRKVVKTVFKHGYRPRGIITLPLYNGDVEIGLEALNVENFEKWVLSRTDKDLGGPKVGQHSFDREGLAKAVTTLREAIRKGCDLLVIDEVGPLELMLDKGFTPILEKLPSQGVRHTLLVVRSTLLQNLLERLGHSGVDVATVTVTRENRSELPKQIFKMLFGVDTHS